MKMARRETAEVFVTDNSPSEEIQTDVTTVPADNSMTEKVEEKIVETPRRDYSSSKERLETIRVNSNHSCYIGGVYYVFKKGMVYQVPSDVKRILTVAKLLAPL